MSTTAQHSDALVKFGATGDLEHKQIFPALYAMVKRGTLTVPVDRDRLLEVGFRAVARACPRQRRGAPGGIDDEAALARLLGLLDYVDGDYAEPAT